MRDFPKSRVERLGAFVQDEVALPFGKMHRLMFGQSAIKLVEAKKSIAALTLVIGMIVLPETKDYDSNA